MIYLNSQTHGISDPNFIQIGGLELVIRIKMFLTQNFSLLVVFTCPDTRFKPLGHYGRFVGIFIFTTITFYYIEYQSSHLAN